MKQKKEIVGKVGYCDNRILGIKNRYGTYSGGHYVYIRSYKNGKCKVNVITSIENQKGVYDLKKLSKVKNGLLYPIPKTDSNFSQWSAINLDGNIQPVKLRDIQDIGKKNFKKRHRFFVGKFTKK